SCLIFIYTQNKKAAFIEAASIFLIKYYAAALLACSIGERNFPLIIGHRSIGKTIRAVEINFLSIKGEACSFIESTQTKISRLLSSFNILPVYHVQSEGVACLIISTSMPINSLSI